jgi:hypothetical protein
MAFLFERTKPSRREAIEGEILSPTVPATKGLERSSPLLSLWERAGSKGFAQLPNFAFPEGKGTGFLQRQQKLTLFVFLLILNIISPSLLLIIFDLRGSSKEVAAKQKSQMLLFKVLQELMIQF